MENIDAVLMSVEKYEYELRTLISNLPNWLKSTWELIFSQFKAWKGISVIQNIEKLNNLFL